MIHSLLICTSFPLTEVSAPLILPLFSNSFRANAYQTPPFKRCFISVTRRAGGACSRRLRHDSREIEGCQSRPGNLFEGEGGGWQNFGHRQGLGKQRRDELQE